MDRILVCISSKSPSDLVYNCVRNLYAVQIKDSSNYKVCIVDSDSDDLTIYDKINVEFPSVEVHYVKNKNYEYGAWNYIHKKYPDYDKYICIQDGIMIQTYINLDLVNDTNAYTFHHESGYYHHLSIKEKGIENLRLNGLNCSEIIDSYFNLAQHSTFIVNNRVIHDIFTTLTVPPVDKDGSCFYERNFGLYFIIKNINTMKLNHIVLKFSGNRY